MTPRALRRVLAACVAVAVLVGLGGAGLSASEGSTGGKKPSAASPPPPARQPRETGPPMQEEGRPTREADTPVREAGRPRREAGTPVREDARPMRTPVSLSRLDVTEGELRPGPDGQLTVNGPRMRAVVSGTTAASAELRFTVLGPTVQQVALASGEQRQQVGLKLRALDGCNLVYVMWRIAPKPGVVVNYKRNPGQHTSHECGNGGYTTVRPLRRVSVDAPAPGREHTLRTVLDGRRLRVWADGTLAWEGELPEEALASDGPVGLRSDNVRLALELYSPLP